MSKAILVCEECVTLDELDEMRPYSKTAVALVVTLFIIFGIAAASFVWMFHALRSVGFVMFGGMAVVLVILGMLFARQNVNGRELWIMLDDEGKVHRHLKADVVGPIGFSNWTDYYRKGNALFIVRVGGWFRRSFLKKEQGEGYWDITSWTGEDIQLRDRGGSCLNHRNWAGGLENGLDVLLKAPCQHRDISHVLSNAMRVPSLEKELSELRGDSAAYDRFGVAIMLLIEQMEESKDTLGRSKHAQVVREFLEHVISSTKNVGSPTIYRWKNEHHARIDLKIELINIITRVTKKAPAEEPATSEAPSAATG